MEEFEYLWKGPNPQGALVARDPRPGEPEPRYLVLDRGRNMIILIEDDEIARAVKKELLHVGAPILTADEVEPWEDEQS